VLEFEHPDLAVNILECHSPDAGFKVGEMKRYRQGPAGWKRLE
jgi:hypothetical protein